MADKAASIIGVVFFLIVGVVLISLYVSQCHVGDSNSITFNIKQLTLLTKPTDTNIFGIDWFGKPKDEIAVHVWCGMCVSTSPYQEIGEGQTIKFDHRVNSFFTFALKFRLEESDGGLEGRNDHSDTYKIGSDEMDELREQLKDDANKVELKYHMTVKGGDLFSENKIFGFIAKNLCVSAFDFVMGPWAKLAKGGKVNAALKFLGKDKSGMGKKLFDKDVAKLYERLGDAYEGGKVKKKAIYEAVAAYQMKAGLKAAVKKPMKRNLMEFATELALNATKLDEEIRVIYDEMLMEGLQETATEEEYDVAKSVVAQWGDVMQRVTDSLEFCLDEIKPRSEDAKYYLEMEAVRE